MQFKVQIKPNWVFKRKCVHRCWWQPFDDLLSIIIHPIACLISYVWVTFIKCTSCLFIMNSWEKKVKPFISQNENVMTFDFVLHISSLWFWFLFHVWKFVIARCPGQYVLRSVRAWVIYVLKMNRLCYFATEEHRHTKGVGCTIWYHGRVTAKAMAGWNSNRGITEMVPCLQHVSLYLNT